MATRHRGVAIVQKLNTWTVAAALLVAGGACNKAQPSEETKLAQPAAANAPRAAPAAPPPAQDKATQEAARPQAAAAPAGLAAATDRELEPGDWNAKQAYGAAGESENALADKAPQAKALGTRGSEPAQAEAAPLEEAKRKAESAPSAGVAGAGRQARASAGSAAAPERAGDRPKAVAKEDLGAPGGAGKANDGDERRPDPADRPAKPTAGDQGSVEGHLEMELDPLADKDSLRRDRPLLLARPQPCPATRRPRPALASVPYRSPDKPLRRLPSAVVAYPKDARYRSTYLPGRGYLQHLQASIQQAAGEGGPGLASALAVQPQHARPSLPQPQGSALKVAIELSHKQLPADGGRVTVRVRLRGAAQRPTERMPLRLHLVVDSSGSMKGKPWQQVCAAVELLSQRLLPSDQMSITVFSESAQVLAAPTPGGPALAELARRVCQLKPRGETNTFAGLQLGYQQARSSYSGEATNRVLLISDGLATVGPREPYEITADTSRALGQGITTSGLGIGRDFDALLMNRIALEGGGNHHFVREAAALPAVIVDELEVLSQQAAEAVDVRISLPQDVELLEVVGSEPLGAAESLRARQVEVASDQRIARDTGIAANRQRDFDGGVRFLLPAFRAGDEHAFVLVVQVPPGSGQREVARLAVRYKDLINKKNAGFVGGRVIQFAEPGAPAAGVAEPDVLLTEARARASYALQRASEYMEDINLPAIRSELYSAALQLQKAADATGSAVAQAESARLQALADGATEALRRRQGPWLAAVLHYQWRVCGLTSWAE